MAHEKPIDVNPALAKWLAAELSGAVGQLGASFSIGRCINVGLSA
jgi:hypothetical protein